MRFGQMWGTFIFEDAFSSPYFELADTRLLVLRAIFEATSSRFSIDPRDLKVNVTDNLGDLRVTVAAFGGLGKVEIAPTFMRVSFEQLRAIGDWSLVGDFVGCVDQAIRKFISVDRIRIRSVSRLVHLGDPSDPSFNVDTFLFSLVSDRAKLDLEKFGAIRCDYGIQAKVYTETQVAELVIEKSLHADGLVFANGVVRFLAKIPEAADCIRSSDAFMRGILSEYSVEIP